MPAKTLFAPLTARDIEELVPVLLNERVFAFIGGMPTSEDFTLGLHRAIAGPPASFANQHWINFAVRLAETGRLIGRVEATVHDNLAEVAFLYSPSVWGQGYAMEGLLWLHEHLRGYKDVAALWATTHPANHRSAALLRRAGYAEVASSALPLLYSFDEGDVVFSRGVA